MISKLKYLPINWKNGMSFSEDHLKQQDLANIDRTRDALALHLTGYNYGILGGSGQKKISEAFRDNINNEKVEVPYCRAITQNGSRIEILNQEWEELKKPLTELIGDKNLDNSKYWYVLLIIDPFIRIPDGIENETESPRRKPNTRPAYKLELIALNELKLDSLANAIPLAKFESTSAGLKKIEAYIPPCARINSHESLIKIYEAYDNYMMSIKESSKKIIDVVKNKRKHRENTPLSDDIEQLCKKYISFFIESYDDYKYTFMDQPPIKLVSFFAKLARSLAYAMDTAYDKSHMLKYFNEYATHISAPEINRIINNTFEQHYVHYDLLLSLEVIDKFLSTIDEVFKQLEKLDYRELARKNIVKQDKFTGSYGQPDQTRKRTPDIKIKRPGISENLEDELDG